MITVTARVFSLMALLSMDKDKGDKALCFKARKLIYKPETKISDSEFMSMVSDVNDCMIRLNNNVYLFDHYYRRVLATVDLNRDGQAILESMVIQVISQMEHLN